MCGRYVSATPPDQIAAYFDAEAPEALLEPSYNVAPTKDVYAVLSDGTTRKLTDDEVFSYCRLIMLAGGGTTWRQLGIGDKPCAIFDIEGYYQPLVAMMDRMVEERFLHPGQREDLWTGRDMDAMLDWMRAYRPASATKWLDEKRSREMR